MVAVASNPLLKVCPRCHRESLHRPRGDAPKRPRTYCRDCEAENSRRHRENNWQRAKARNTWKGMILRCHQPRHASNCPPGIPRYEHYGAKGISVCKRWRDRKMGFANFLADLGLPPFKSWTLDRKNPRRNYTPSNCRWVDRETQMVNRKNAHWITAEDPNTDEVLTLCISQWARRMGINRYTISSRIGRGWKPEWAVVCPVRRPGEEVVDDQVPF